MHEAMHAKEKNFLVPGMHIDTLDFIVGHKWNILQEIDVSRNQLFTIEVLNEFKNIKILRASNNRIVEVFCILPNLE